MAEHELKTNDAFPQSITLVKGNLNACAILQSSSSSAIEEAFTNIPGALQNLQLTNIKLTYAKKYWGIASLDSTVTVDGKLTKASLEKFGLALANFKGEFDKLQHTQPNITLKAAIENITENFETETFKFYVTSSLEMYIALYNELKKLNPSISKNAIIMSLHSEFKKNETEELDTSKHFPEILNDYLEAICTIEEFSLKTKGKAEAQHLASRLKELAHDYFSTRLALEIHGNKNNLPKNFKSLEEANEAIKEKIEAYKNTPDATRLNLLYTLLHIIAKLLPSVMLSSEDRKHFFFKYTGKKKATELETRLTATICSRGL
jgi:hypothetical protein